MEDFVEFQLNTPSGVKKLLHRGTAADNGVLNQIFNSQDYHPNRLRRGPQILSFYQSVVDNGGQPLIIDCGANMGASPVWFSTAYPDAVVVAIEPEKGNYDLLVQNTMGMRIETHMAAIGSRDGQVHVFDPGNGEWGYQASVEGSGPVVAQLSMRDLVVANMAKGRTPFIAKIDIEGGERELFSQATEWIDFFPLIIIELHDWLLTGTGNSRNFIKSIASSDRDFVHVGENVFSIRNF